MVRGARRVGAALAVAVAMLAVIPAANAAGRHGPRSPVRHTAAPSTSVTPVTRPLRPVPRPTPSGDPCAAARPRLTARLDAALDGAHVSVAVHERTTGEDYDYAPGETFETASVAKVSILVTLLTRAQRTGRALTPGERALARRAIEYSDNHAADALWADVGGAVPVGRTLRRLHLRHTEVLDALGWGLTRTTARDQVRLLSALTGDAGDLSAGRRAYALDLMSHVAPEQAWGVSAAAGGDDDASVALKNGWLARSTDGKRWIINSIGRVRTHGRDFLIAVLSNHHPTSAAGIAVVQRAARITAHALDACLPLPVPPRKPTR